MAAIASMIIAIKVEDRQRTPALDEVIVAVGGRRYDVNHLTEMEMTVLTALDFKVSRIPTTRAFLHIMTRAMRLPFIPSSLAYCFAEVSLLSYDLQQFTPGQIAAACIRYAMFLMPPPSSMEHLTAPVYMLDAVMTKEVFGSLMTILVNLHEQCQVHNPSAYIKYMQSSYGRVAHIRPVYA
jgi:hypothetical protein